MSLLLPDHKSNHNTGSSASCLTAYIIPVMPISKKRYAGTDKDIDGGMTVAGRIIRDAWAFGIIHETETCEG